MKVKPNRFNANQLIKVGVEILDPNKVTLRCVTCGQVWSPNIKEGGRLPNGYWECPNGCNMNLTQPMAILWDYTPNGGSFAYRNKINGQLIGGSSEALSYVKGID